MVLRWGETDKITYWGAYFLSFFSSFLPRGVNNFSEMLRLLPCWVKKECYLFSGVYIVPSNLKAFPCPIWKSFPKSHHTSIFCPFVLPFLLIFFLFPPFPAFSSLFYSPLKSFPICFEIIPPGGGGGERKFFKTLFFFLIFYFFSLFFFFYFFPPPPWGGGGKSKIILPWYKDRKSLYVACENSSIFSSSKVTQF